MNLLFSYGTFRSLYVQLRLFGHEIETKNAVLNGYAVYEGVDGYHGLQACEGSSVNGALLDLTDRELEIADGWEISPQLYIRRELNVLSGGKPVEAWVYFRADFSSPGARIDDSSLLFTLPQEQLERELNEYLESL